MNDHEVRYLVIGAHAVAFHARPRATKDLDLVSEVPECPSFAAAWRRRVEARFGSVKAYYLGLDDLIRAKEAIGRVQDHADVRVLKQAKTQPQRSRRRPGRRN